MVLREEPLCRRCGEPATDVDHIVSRERGGEDTRENLQALCHPCHSQKTVEEDGGFRGGGGAGRGGARRHPLVTVVCGPPGAGKSTWVRERMRWGDLLLDLDALYVAMSGLPQYDKPDTLLPFVMEARDAILERLVRPSEITRAWVVTTAPKRLERDRLRRTLKAKVIVIETSASECIKRIGCDERRSDRVDLWRDKVEGWWSNYERDERDTVVSA